MAKKKMLQFAPELSARLQSRLSQSDFNFEKRKMFGHETFFTNGYMFTGANQSGIFVHVGRKDGDRALSEESGVAPFSPMEGMTMRDYLLLKDEIVNSEPALGRWLDRSYSYLNQLPSKPKKNKKK